MNHKQSLTNDYHGCSIESTYDTVDGEAVQTHAVSAGSSSLGPFDTLAEAIRAAKSHKQNPEPRSQSQPLSQPQSPTMSQTPNEPTHVPAKGNDKKKEK